MPVINRERWNLLEPLLDEAMDLTPEERTPWLEALSRSSPEIAAQLSALLSDDSSADREGFLTRPLDLTLEGLEVGAYTLERPLGHGGMGSVWLAKRSDGRFEGKAAVKLLKLSLLSAAGQERFRREGSALARLEHPGIARLLDAGVSRSGQPYLVLEYVDGQQLDTWANDRTLSSDDRIRLFLRVLEAVGHAHANLLVHRDLKPSNILVTQSGSVKLLDFGIAKLSDDRIGGHAAAVTMEGGRAFTPQFAAPEQIRGESITTATDVYALGVILYLLLSRRHPTAANSRTPADAIRATLEVQPAALAPRDLGSVVAKALRKDPAERYQNVESFADDLQRYLRHEPVLAGRDPLPYRTWKFARRHRGGVAVGAAIAGILITAGIVLLGEAREARRQRDVAVAAGQRADAQAELASLLMSQVGDRPTTVREILDRTTDAVTHEFAHNPAFLSSALVQLGEHYGALDDIKTRGGLLARAESIALAAHDTLRLIEVRCDLADNARLQGEPAQADRILHSAESLLDRYRDPEVEVGCLLSRSELANEMNHPDRSAPAIHRAIAIRDSLGKTRDLVYVDLLSDLAYTLDRQGRTRDGTVVLQRSVALMDSTGRNRTLSSATAVHDLGLMHKELGETDTAEALLHETLLRVSRADSSGHIATQPLIHYAHAALYQGDADSARKYFAILAAEGAADHNTYWEGRALFGLSQAELMLGRRREAMQTIERFRAISGNRNLAKSDDQVVNVNTLDALVALAAGDTARGNTLLQRTLTQYGYYSGKRHRSTLHSTLMLSARTALALHHPDSALVYARDARVAALDDSVSEQRSAFVGETWLLEARAVLQQGDTVAARGDARHALQALLYGAGPNNPRTREATALVTKLGSPPV